MALRLFLICLLSTVYLHLSAQVLPKPKPAQKKTNAATGMKGNGAPSNGAGGNAGSGFTGFRVVTIPVYGDIKLGMDKKEYDSISTKSSSRELVTAKRNYSLTLAPRFVGPRLLMLKFSTAIQELDSLPTDILEKFTGKYERPDSSDLSTKNIANPSSKDKKNDSIKIVKCFYSWNFRYYDLRIEMTYQQKTNGRYFGSTELIFAGNASYYMLLRDLERKDEF